MIWIRKIQIIMSPNEPDNQVLLLMAWKLLDNQKTRWVINFYFFSNSIFLCLCLLSFPKISQWCKDFLVFLQPFQASILRPLALQKSHHMNLCNQTPGAPLMLCLFLSGTMAGKWLLLCLKCHFIIFYLVNSFIFWFTIQGWAIFLCTKDHLDIDIIHVTYNNLNKN